MASLDCDYRTAATAAVPEQPYTAAASRFELPIDREERMPDYLGLTLERSSAGVGPLKRAGVMCSGGNAPVGSFRSWQPLRDERVMKLTVGLLVLALRGAPLILGPGFQDQVTLRISGRAR